MPVGRLSRAWYPQVVAHGDEHIQELLKLPVGIVHMQQRCYWMVSMVTSMQMPKKHGVSRSNDGLGEFKQARLS